MSSCHEKVSGGEGSTCRQQLTTQLYGSSCRQQQTTQLYGSTCRQRSFMEAPADDNNCMEAPADDNNCREAPADNTALWKRLQTTQLYESTCRQHSFMEAPADNTALWKHLQTTQLYGNTYRQQFLAGRGCLRTPNLTIGQLSLRPAKCGHNCLSYCPSSRRARLYRIVVKIRSQSDVSLVLGKIRDRDQHNRMLAETLTWRTRFFAHPSLFPHTPLSHHYTPLSLSLTTTLLSLSFSHHYTPLSLFLSPLHSSLSLSLTTTLLSLSFSHHYTPLSLFLTTTLLSLPLTLTPLTSPVILPPTSLSLFPLLHIREGATFSSVRSVIWYASTGGCCLYPAPRCSQLTLFYLSKLLPVYPCSRYHFSSVYDPRSC
ncbi:hypothetical protein FHG87_009758 [Trinorchestia longiramus]|nr:hypothetical protein FHG87_009758 [Trinorchestia longiramus]